MNDDKLRIDSISNSNNFATSVIYKDCVAIPGKHYDIETTPVYNGTEVIVNIDLVPRVDDLIVTTMYFKARYKNGTWHHEKVNWSLNSEEAQKLQLKAAIIRDDINELGKLDDVVTLNAFLGSNGFHAKNAFIDGNTMSEGIIITKMGSKQKEILDEIIVNNGWHVRSRYATKAEGDSVETHGAWISRKTPSLKERIVDTVESLMELLKECGFEHAYHEPIDVSNFKFAFNAWEVSILTKLKEKTWIAEHVKIPGATISLTPVGDAFQETPAMAFRTTVTGQKKKIEKFPSELSVREFMRDFKNANETEIDRRIENQKSGGLLGIADETSLYLETIEITDDLESKLDAFCSKWGARWDSDRVYDDILITISGQNGR